MLTITEQPDNNCVIAKNSCKQLCFQDTSVVESQGSFAFVVAEWLQGDTGATGVFLGKDIELGVTNSAGMFDGTITGFQQMIIICFPELIGSIYTTILDGAVKRVSIQFPTVGAYGSFVFENATSGVGSIGFVATNGTDAVVRDCYFDVKIYDEDDNFLCQIAPQYPNFQGGNPVLTADNCISYWNIGLKTTFPPPLDTVFIDPEFCKKIRYRIWQRCLNETGCGYSTEQIAESELFTVSNSVHDKSYNFEQHCVLARYQEGTLAKFLTQRDKVCICEGVDAWLWICPSILILDTFGLNYDYATRRTYYDSGGTVVGTSDTIIGNSNDGYVIPTGWNFIENATFFPAATASYTVELLIILNGNTFVITQPVTYKLVDCCCEVALYFQEQLGGYTHICFDNCQKKIIDAEGETVCVGDKCDKEILTVGDKASLVYELKTKIADENLRELFVKSRRFYVKLNGEYERVSIEKRRVKLHDSETGAYRVELKIKFLEIELND